jgi:hypothetical protein
LPSTTYRSIWLAVDKAMPPKEACKFIVGLLQLAALHDCENPLGEAVLAALDEGKPLSLVSLQKQFCKEPSKLTQDVQITHASLENYNQCIPQQSEGVACYA